MIVEQNCGNNTTAKKPETRGKVDLLFERGNILSKPGRTIYSKK